MLVETIENGSVVIKVHDDSYAGKSETEIQEIIDEYCRYVTTLLQQK